MFRTPAGLSNIGCGRDTKSDYSLGEKPPGSFEQPRTIPNTTKCLAWVSPSDFMQFDLLLCPFDTYRVLKKPFLTPKTTILIPQRLTNDL